MSKIKSISHCYHCGSEITEKPVLLREKSFCCTGCKTVYEILSENNLGTYYELNEKPGIIQNTTSRKEKYAFLQDIEIQKKIILFSDQSQSHVSFYLPQIHCSSCLWLLENIEKLNQGIISSRVNFVKKEVAIVFNHQTTTLREVVETLHHIGYEPHLSLNEVSTSPKNKTDRTRWYKIGVAGFCFSNIMMMSFADYLAFSNTVDFKISLFLKGIIVLLSLPVIFYAASEFFISAWHGLKNKYLNIDFPVALALIITFSRSMYEILSSTGNGYLDSMSGIVFFMLIGRWLQDRTYENISFDRDYKSFFPIALNVIKNGSLLQIEVSKVKEGNIIKVYGNEIIPLDAILSKGEAKIDYSFVTGESLPVKVNIGEIIYAGGKQLGSSLELIVAKEVSQSYLSSLWNNPVFNKGENIKKTTYDVIAKYFTYWVLAIGFAAGAYWYSNGAFNLMWNAITTVLIVACPCALLLAENFTNGNILRVFGLNKFYLRSSSVIEQLSKINHIVFDKTGTITHANNAEVQYYGSIIPKESKRRIASLLQQSSHPISKIIAAFLNEKKPLEVVHYKEVEGMGIEGWVEEHHIKLGSTVFTGGQYDGNKTGTKMVVFIDGEIIGEFIISNKYRSGIKSLIQSLKSKYSLSLLSGDNDAELKNIETLLGQENEVFFHQSPQQKLDYIKFLQDNKRLNIMMIGDGLNDAGALKQSDLGVAVVDGGNNFTPSCDAIINASKLPLLDRFIQYAITGKKIIFFTFSVSAIYNIIGLYYAVQGVLSPVIAAILMPCSSLTIILLTYGLTEWAASKYGLNDHKTIIDRAK